MSLRYSLIEMHMPPQRDVTGLNSSPAFREMSKSVENSSPIPMFLSHLIMLTD